MIALVSRVAKIKGKDPIDLLPEWQKDVDKALKQNYGEQNSRAFILAAKSFLARNKVDLSIEGLKSVKLNKAPEQRGQGKVPKP